MQATLGKRNFAAGAITAVVLLFVTMLVLFQSNLLDRQRTYPVLPLEEGWTLTEDDTVLGSGALSSLRISKVRVGDTIEATTVLPKDDIRNAALFFEVRQGVIGAYLEEDLFFTYGEDLRDAGRMLKRGNLTIPLPDGWQGKTLRLQITATEPQAFSAIGPVTLGNEQDLFWHFLGERRLPMLLGGFLFVYALFQFLWLPYMLLRREGAFLSTLYSALITLALGLYQIGYYDLFDLFLKNASGSTIAEYATLYSMPCLFSAYLGLMMHDRAKQVCNLCAIVDGTLFAAVVVLHVTGLVHLTLFLAIFYIVSLAESVLFFIGIRRTFTEMRRTGQKGLEAVTDYTILIGFIIFVICAFADAAVYAWLRMFGAGAGVEGIPFMMLGSMCFTVALTAQFFLHGVTHLRADVTRDRLEQRAYVDPLTGLANRIRCEQEMMQLKMDAPFVIISLDLDGLKAVNDSLGHAEGDRMLQGFAKALSACFEGMTLIGRMGGDEFLVILTGTECVVTDAKLKELEHALFNLNTEEPYFHYSVSYGYASNSETHFGNRVRDIYMLADRRMYDMKRKKKQEREAEHG